MTANDTPTPEPVRYYVPVTQYHYANSPYYFVGPFPVWDDAYAWIQAAISDPRASNLWPDHVSPYVVELDGDIETAWGVPSYALTTYEATRWGLTDDGGTRLIAPPQVPTAAALGTKYVGGPQRWWKLARSGRLVGEHHDR